MLHKWHRPTDPTLKGEIFGWDSPMIQNHIGATVVKEVGTSITAGPVIRQDLNPIVFEVFVKQFPLIDMLEKRESNGLVDAFERQINYTQKTEDQPLTIGETGAVADDSNQYVQDTCNIAIFAARRGGSLKAAFGARAGGSPIDVLGKEVAGGLLKIAHDFQTEAFRAQNADSSSNAAVGSNLGLYDANGFKGLRYISETQTPSSNVVQVDVTSFNANNNVVTDALSQVCNTIIDLGGNPDMCFGSSAAREYLRKEAFTKARFLGGAMKLEVIPGVFLPSFTLGNGEDLPYYNIPGKSVGSYGIYSGGVSDGHTYIDIYVADTSMLSIVWLGAPSPTLIEVPLASDGTLRKLTIPYWMASLEVAVPMFLGKVRLKIA